MADLSAAAAMLRDAHVESMKRKAAALNGQAPRASVLTAAPVQHHNQHQLGTINKLLPSAAAPAISAPSAPMSALATSATRNASAGTALPLLATESVSASASAQQPIAMDAVDTPFTLVSWNVDGIEGIDDARTRARFTHALAIVLACDADAVCLQEMTSDLLPQLRRVAAAHHALVITPAHADGYFVALVVFRERGWRVGRVLDEAFANSEMGRSVLGVELTKGSKLAVTILTAHLESGAGASAPRIAQAKQVLLRFPHTRGAVVFAGDLNMRDAEQAQLPLGVAESRFAFDAWHALGAHADTKFTWDLQLNTNKQMGGNQPRCRFDRIYCAGPGARGNEVADGVRPVALELLGTDAMSEGYWPSDHFGLLFRFMVGCDGVSGAPVAAAAPTSKRAKRM